jgi:hypothetical protein
MSKGGARFGAGRPGYRLQAEQTWKIDLRVWHKRGLIWNGGTNSWSWSRGSECVGRIVFSVSADSILLSYAINGQDASQTIWTTTTPCRFGGARRWFNCPSCAGRVMTLFMRSGRFACRKCQHISYSSQSGSETSRGFADYHQLKGLIQTGKPKWTRWATFQKVCDRFDRVEARVNLSLWKVVQRLRQ